MTWFKHIFRVGFLALVVVLLLVIVVANSAEAAWGHRVLKRPAVVSQPHRLLVGYFPQWGLYNDTPYTVKALVDSKAAGMLDQINYAQGFVTGGQCSIADPNADIDHTFPAEGSVDGSVDSPVTPVRGYFHQLAELKRLYPHLKILISLEGRGSDFAADAQPEQRAAFVASCVNLFLKGNFNAQASMPGLFDGIDLDWEFPRGADSANYLPLLTEFRRQMDALRPGLVLSVALGPSPRMYGDADVAALGRVVDEAGLMTYDFNGPWSSTTGFIAPLSSTSDDGSVERSVAAWKTAGMPSEKLLLGLPFYGYGWKQVADTDHGFGQDGRPIRGDHPYRFIEALIRQTGRPNVVADSSAASTPSSKPPVLYRDPVSQAPWLFDGDSFWTYEDPISIRSKASYAASQQLGGFMVWELSDDTQDATLLKAAHTALLKPISQPAEPISRP